MINNNAPIVHGHDVDIHLVGRHEEPRIDSRALAEQLELKHRSVFALLSRYKDDFKQLGLMRFQIAKPPKGTVGGRPEKYTMLNEDQAYLLLTYSRNTDRVRSLKVKLVKAFSQARKAVEQHQTDYLPTYHALHDQIKAAGGDRFQHLNFNRVINKAAGITAKNRHGVVMPVKSAVVVAHMMAMQSIGQSDGDLKHAYSEFKGRLDGLLGALSANPNQCLTHGEVA